MGSGSGWSWSQVLMITAGIVVAGLVLTVVSRVV